jgi:hypothetical protein
MAKLSAEEPDALMHARPGPWEPWRVTARATQPAARKDVLSSEPDPALTALLADTHSRLLDLLNEELHEVVPGVAAG